jgi:MFS transporter, Spinster family, sphingosine-1-phosphate transporter
MVGTVWQELKNADSTGTITNVALADLLRASVATRESRMNDTATPQPLPEARRALALLLAINLFNYIDRYILAAVQPLISHHFLGSADKNALAKTGSLATAFLVSYMVLAPVFGWLADRFSRWLIIATGVALWSLASGWSGMASSFVMLLVTRLFVGVGEAAYGPSAPTIISDLYPVQARGRVLAYFYLAIPVGTAIGYAFGGAVGERLGWRWPFYLVTAPGLALAAVCLFMRDPRGVRARAGEKKPPIRIADVLGLFRIPSYVLNTGAMAAMTFAIGGISNWFPQYLYDFRRADFGGSPSLAQINTTFGGVTVVAGLFSTLLGGIVADKLQRRFAGAYFLVSGIAMLAAFPLVIAMLYTPFPWAWAFVFLAVFCLFFNTGPSNAALANVTSPAIRATAFAVNILIIHALGDAISPLLIGAIADRWNMNVAFGVVSLVMLLGGVLWLAGVPHLSCDMERVSSLPT